MARTPISSKNTSSKVQNGPIGSARSNGSSRSVSKSSENKSSKNESTLDDLLENLLKDIYSGEVQLLGALERMADAADSEELKDAFNHHLEQTKKQVERLSKIFTRLNINTSEVKTCKAIEAIISEGRSLIKNFDNGPVRDSALIIAAQKIEHYEIASYGSICELCDVLGYHRMGEILSRSLDEEENTDEHLTEIAMDINDEAVEASFEEGGGSYGFSNN